LPAPATIDENHHAGRVSALDGLRGIAILLVVGFHAGGGLFPGGWVGVDLFFVLSGFLITTLLLEEHRANGRVSLRSFYARRARRLLPALAVFLIAFVAFTGFRHLSEIAASLLYFENIALAFLHAPEGWFVPFWSLSAEEQFYFVWPLALIAFLKWRPQSTPWVLALTLVALEANRVVLFAGGASGMRTIAAPDMRSDGLLVGCLLAWLRFRGLRLRRTAMTVGVLAAPFVAHTAYAERAPGETLPLIVLWFAAVVSLALDGGMLARLLAAPPLVYLGGISYALYIWNMPMQDVLGGPWYGALAIVVAVVIAQLSTRYVERPLRRPGFFKTRAAAAPRPAELVTE
jgi:peptidoglycan/LPS O-acetylase OafA/YrhL